LLAGVSLSYSAIKSGIQVSKELENAQEVLRYSNTVLTRSTKQSFDLPVVSADGMTITYTMPAGVIRAMVMCLVLLLLNVTTYRTIT